MLPPSPIRPVSAGCADLLLTTTANRQTLVNAHPRVVNLESAGTVVNHAAADVRNDIGFQCTQCPIASSNRHLPACINKSSKFILDWYRLMRSYNLLSLKRICTRMTLLGKIMGKDQEIPRWACHPCVVDSDNVGEKRCFLARSSLHPKTRSRAHARCVFKSASLAQKTLSSP